MGEKTYHVLGSGNALDPGNDVFRARLTAAADRVVVGGGIIVLHGSDQEVSSAKQFLSEAYPDAGLRIGIARPSKSTSETCAAIVRIFDGKWAHYGFIPAEHVVVTNGVYMPRTRYLMRRRWQEFRPGVPWKRFASMVAFLPVGGTFVPYWQRDGWKAVPIWLWAVPIREVLAWGKALLDPFDGAYNQKRWSARWFFRR